MKKIVTFLFLGIIFMTANRSFAQSFTVQHDTVYINGGAGTSVNNITNTGSVTDTIQWKIATSNLPSDWMSTVGVCDNLGCFGSADLWPTSTKECPYPVGTRDFHVTYDFTSATGTGPFVFRIRLNNKMSPTVDTAWQTYIVSKPPTSTVIPVKINTEISLYPNPATSALNVVYDASADVKNIAIYNIIGKQMSLFRVTDNTSASLNLENIPSGIYFVRLVNSHGDVVTTRKFTKQ